MFEVNLQTDRQDRSKTSPNFAAESVTWALFSAESYAITSLIKSAQQPHDVENENGSKNALPRNVECLNVVLYLG